MRETARRGSGQTFGELRELQRKTFAAIRQPLTPARRLPSRWIDGRPTRKVLAEFIKPNDRLTSFERVEIYSKSYWFRVLDCLYDDYPGLRAVLGERKFYKLRVAYLDRYPSQSFTLRNLGSRLVEFLREEPKWAAPHQRMALDMARFEWAQVVAFDGPELPALTPDDLLGRDPAKLRLGIQPHMTLLELAYPLDDFVVALKKQSGGPQVRSKQRGGRGADGCPSEERAAATTQHDSSGGAPARERFVLQAPSCGSISDADGAA